MTASDSGPERLTQLLGLRPGAARSAIAGPVVEAGEPSYRIDQIADWIYGRRACSFEEMTNLPAELRQRLYSEFSLTPAYPYI